MIDARGAGGVFTTPTWVAEIAERVRAIVGEGVSIVSIPAPAPALSNVYPSGTKANVPPPKDLLYYAARDRKVDELITLRSEWAGNPAMLNWRNSNGQTPLFMTCGCDRHEVVSVLIGTAGVDLNMADNWGQSPLWIAAYWGSTQSVRVLLSAKERGLDLNQKDEDGKTPLTIARERKNIEVVELLEEAGAWAPPPPLPLPAHSYVYPSGPKANLAVADGMGLRLYSAAENGRVDEVRTLCSEWAGNPAILNWREAGGCTPLFVACGRDRHEVVSVLIGTAGVDLNMADDWGKSPLWWAAYNGRTQVVRVLLSAKERGLDLNQKPTSGNCIGKTPLKIAREYTNREVVNLLEEAGALSRHSQCCVLS